MKIIKKIGYLLSFFLIIILIGCSDLTKTTTKKQDSNDKMDLEIHFIDVGQADSIYINLPNHEHMLIDAGNNSDGEVVSNYLSAQGVTNLDYVVGTHPHEDHVGGLDDIINDFSIGKIYLPDIASTTQTYQDVLLAIQNNNVTTIQAKEGVVLFNTTVDGKTLKAEMFSPISESYTDTNDYSPIIKLTYGDTAYLFTGDAEVHVEEEILEKGYNLKADVLKLGHHGSISSTSQAFLNAVNPTYGIISVGEGNTYGHPDQDIINRLSSKGIQIYRTDEAGTITVKSNGYEITVSTDEHYNPNPVVTTTTEVSYHTSILINEFLPAPKDVYTQEWVELYNPTSETVDLSGYIIDDIDGGSQPMVIDDGVTIEPHSYYVFYTENVFNNSDDEVRLLSPDGTVIDTVTYQSTNYDTSWYLDNGNWHESSSPTPNADNN